MPVIAITHDESDGIEEGQPGEEPPSAGEEPCHCQDELGQDPEEEPWHCEAPGEDPEEEPCEAPGEVGDPEIQSPAEADFEVEEEEEPDTSVEHQTWPVAP